MKHRALLIAVGAKPKAESGAKPKAKGSATSAKEYADLAAEALLDKDKAGASRALRGLVEACLRSSECEDDDDDDED